MKVGDLVRANPDYVHEGDYCVLGTVLEFIPTTHSKQVPKIKVLREGSGEVEDWIIQYCKVVSESR